MATKQFTFSDLKDILVNRIGIPEDQVVDDPNLTFEDIGLDSLALVELVLAVQQTYGFEIPDKDTQYITTVGQAMDYTNRRLQEGA